MRFFEIDKHNDLLIGDDIRIALIRTRDLHRAEPVCQLGIDAPRDVTILRTEIAAQIAKESNDDEREPGSD